MDTTDKGGFTAHSIFKNGRKLDNYGSFKQSLLVVVHGEKIRKGGSGLKGKEREMVKSIDG